MPGGLLDAIHSLEGREFALASHRQHKAPVPERKRPHHFLDLRTLAGVAVDQVHDHSEERAAAEPFGQRRAFGVELQARLILQVEFGAGGQALGGPLGFRLGKGGQSESQTEQAGGETRHPGE